MRLRDCLSSPGRKCINLSPNATFATICELSPSEGRPLADDRYALAIAGIGEVVPYRMVLRHAVVPEGQRVRPPADAALEFDMAFDVPPQHLEDRVAFALRELIDADREAAVDEQREFAAVRMAGDDRMDRIRPTAFGP